MNALLKALAFVCIAAAAAHADVPWPAQTWAQGHDLTASAAQQADLSGSCYNATGGYVLALRQDGRIWRYTFNATLQTWTTISPFTLPVSGDHEGLTQFDEASDPVDGTRVLVLDEGSGGGHNDSFVRLFKNLFTTPTLVRTWKVGCAAGCSMPGEVNNADGPEAIAFVPNNSLSARGFVDRLGAARLGTAVGASGLGGLVFIGHQSGGLIYVFDLKTNADNALTFVGTYDTGSSFNEIAGLEFDRLNGLLYILHGANDDTVEVTDLTSASSGVAGIDRVFSTLARTTSADAGAQNNLEGLAIIPPDMCAANGACQNPQAVPTGSIFMTCDGCTPAFKWMEGLHGDWLRECPPSCAPGVAGDLTCDASVDGLDIARFVELQQAGRYTCQADMDHDRDVDQADVDALIAALLGE